MERIAFAVLIGYFAVIIAFVYGWISNIISLLQMDSVTTGMGIARIAGIFVAPLGAVLGYL